MKITFPHMGTLHISMEALFEELGYEVVLAPRITKRTLDLGIKYSPETACLPFKYNVGNFIEASRKGADTVVMAGGHGPCRFGYYGAVQREILKDERFPFEMIILEAPQEDPKELWNKIKKLKGKNSWKQVLRAINICWAKMKACDQLEELSFKVRPREKRRGATSKAFRHGLDLVNKAKELKEIKESARKGIEFLNQVEQKEVLDLLKVGIVGEIYDVLEPFAHQDIPVDLGEMGVEIDRSIYLHKWVYEHLFIPIVPQWSFFILKWIYPQVVSNIQEHLEEKSLIKEAARPYLEESAGGHSLESVGNMVLYAQRGFDGVIHLQPFTCLPETVAIPALERIARDFHIPLLHITLDEQTAKTGLRTRLEAFVDMIRVRKGKFSV